MAAKAEGYAMTLTTSVLEAIRERDAIQQFWQNVRASGTQAVALHTVSVDPAKYVVVWEATTRPPLALCHRHLEQSPGRRLTSLTEAGRARDGRWRRTCCCTRLTSRGRAPAVGRQAQRFHREPIQ